MNEKLTDLERKVAEKAFDLQQFILLSGMNMSSSTVGALRLAARMIELGRQPEQPSEEEVRLEISFATADSQRHKS